MAYSMKGWVLVVLLISVVLSLMKPKVETEKLSLSSVFLASSFEDDDISDGSTLEYDFYRSTCPHAETIVRSTMANIHSHESHHENVSAALLRLFFHDCFIKGCDASVFLDDGKGNKSHHIERDAIPNETLKGFDEINLIKEELEKACPGVVSCADTLALATRDGIVLAGGPFYPVFTGRRDSLQSYFEEALAEIPRPDGNLTQTLHLFTLRGFSERDTVSLLGGHNIGTIGCKFIYNRLYNFSGTGQPDPTIASDFLNEMRLRCQDTDSSSSIGSPAPMRSRGMSESTTGMSYYQGLSSSISSGAGFNTHYYQNLLRGRGRLFADQQLMADETTARLVRAYASDDGSTFRADFARAMVKMSNLGVLTGSQGQVRIKCSLLANGS